MKDKSLFQKWKDYAFLHISILIYSITIVLSKVASDFPFLSLQYILCYGGMVAVLGIYAILWQQVIKRFEPSVAYSHKSVTVIWALLISGFLFGENITLGNVIGTVLIVTGVVMVSQDE
ncbi:MAG: EamA family transporter [Oscillospiraceae bacterium]|nr:EamA family transporter [Oscillospiraceae bacterium]